MIEGKFMQQDGFNSHFSNRNGSLRVVGIQKGEVIASVLCDSAHFEGTLVAALHPTTNAETASTYVSIKIDNIQHCGRTLQEEKFPL